MSDIIRIDQGKPAGKRTYLKRKVSNPHLRLYGALPGETPNPEEQAFITAMDRLWTRLGRRPTLPEIFEEAKRLGYRLTRPERE